LKAKGSLTVIILNKLVENQGSISNKRNKERQGGPKEGKGNSTLNTEEQEDLKEGKGDISETKEEDLGEAKLGRGVGGEALEVEEDGEGGEEEEVGGP